MPKGQKTLPATRLQNGGKALREAINGNMDELDDHDDRIDALEQLVDSLIGEPLSFIVLVNGIPSYVDMRGEVVREITQ